MPARLAVLARRATTAGGTVPLPAQAALVGLVASLAQERPELRPLLLDLEGDVPPAVPASGDHTVLAWRNGKLLAPQLVARPLAANPDPPFSLARASSNTLDDLRWAPATRRTPGAGEVEIEIATTGINFRDVMNLLGVYPGDGGAPGVECAGTVTAVGSDVTGVAPGDTVVAIAPACFASHVIADANLVCRIPLSLDWRQVAAQPVALLTARLALDDVAHLQKGQRILIHAATGGVGLAAVALAKARGAIIVATAGNPAKRAHLRALGISEIHDSRTLDFARCAPVDIVLNSLTGPAIPAGLKALKPGGLFLELGKAELWSREQVDAVRRDVRYEIVALDRLILDEPRRVGAMLRDSVAALATESWLPCRVASVRRCHRCVACPAGRAPYRQAGPQPHALPQRRDLRDQRRYRRDRPRACRVDGRAGRAASVAADASSRRDPDRRRDGAHRGRRPGRCRRGAPRPGKRGARYQGRLPSRRRAARRDRRDDDPRTARRRVRREAAWRRVAGRSDTRIAARSFRAVRLACRTTGRGGPGELRRGQRRARSDRRQADAPNGTPRR